MIHIFYNSKFKALYTFFLFFSLLLLNNNPSFAGRTGSVTPPEVEASFPSTCSSTIRINDEGCEDTCMSSVSMTPREEGDQAFERGDYQKAYKLYKSVYEDECPRDPSFYKRAAQTAREIYLYNEELAFLEKEKRRIRKPSGEHYERLAKAAYDAGEYKKAYTYGNLVAQLNSEEVEKLYWKGGCKAIEHHRDLEALYYFRRIIAQNPEVHWMVYENAIECAYALKRYRTVLRWTDELLERKPEPSVKDYRRAEWAATQLKKYRLSHKYYKGAFSIDSHHRALKERRKAQGRAPVKYLPLLSNPYREVEYYDLPDSRLTLEPHFCAIQGFSALELGPQHVDEAIEWLALYIRLNTPLLRRGVYDAAKYVVSGWGDRNSSDVELALRKLRVLKEPSQVVYEVSLRNSK